MTTDITTTIIGPTQRRVNRPCLRWLATSPASQAQEGPGEAANEICTDPATPPPYTSTSLWQSQEATANQIEAMKPDAVALLGDLQYQVGRYSDFEGSFDLTYGAFKFLHRPSPGNHEFYDEHGQTGVAGYGYFSYYNGFQIDSKGNPLTTTIPDPCPTPNASCKAGKTAPADSLTQPIPRADGQAGHFDLVSGGLNGAGLGDGWYSYNLGSWHLISLNIQCYTQPDTRGMDGCSSTNAWFASELEVAEKGSRGKSFRVHTRLLASALVQRCRQPQPKRARPLWPFGNCSTSTTPTWC